MTFSNKFEAIELIRLIKDSQKITGEMKMKDLITKMMTLFLESSGADRGVFFVERSGDPAIEAVGVVEEGEIQVWHSSNLGELEQLGRPHIYPHSIIEQVWRSGQNVVLPDASLEFGEDNYMRQNSPRSVLCIPSIFQGRMQGLLYLENNLFNAAFTESRVQVLGLLASQIAVFIENARTHHRLEELVEKRTFELKVTNDLLGKSEDKFSKAFRYSPNLMAISRIEDGKFIEVNETFCRILGYTIDEIVGKTSLELSIWADPSDRRRFINSLKTNKEVRDFEIKVRKKTGDIFVTLFSGVIISLAGVNYLLSIATDITERKKLEEQLKAAAITDDLTGLYNRRGFFTLTEQQCKIANRRKQKMSLLYTDLDDLKIINDRYGHQAGDKALAAVGEILKSSFRESDIVGRIGGDEFAILLIDYSGHDIETVITRNVNQQIGAFNKKREKEYPISLSMGFSHFDPQNPCTIGELLSQADAAMYKVKKNGKSSGKIPIVTAETNGERRKGNRYTIKNKFPAHLDQSGEFFVKNISSGGVCLLSEKKIPEKKVCRLAIAPPKTRPIVIEGEVIWSCPLANEEEGGNQGSYYESGIKFVSSKDKNDSPLGELLAGARKAG